jgi:hypothetical protein
MKYIDDQILSEAYAKIMESHPDPTQEYDQETPQEPEVNKEHPELQVFGYGSMKPDTLLSNCERYINNIKDILNDLNHNDPEETYFGIFNQAGLLVEHAKALDNYATKLFRQRKKELDAKK